MKIGKILQNMEITACKIAKMAISDTFDWLKIDFRKNLSGSKILEFPQGFVANNDV